MTQPAISTPTRILVASVPSGTRRRTDPFFVGTSGVFADVYVSQPGTLTLYRTDTQGVLRARETVTISSNEENHVRIKHTKYALRLEYANAGSASAELVIELSPMG